MMDPMHVEISLIRVGALWIRRAEVRQSSKFLKMVRSQTRIARRLFCKAFKPALTSILSLGRGASIKRSRSPTRTGTRIKRTRPLCDFSRTQRKPQVADHGNCFGAPRLFLVFEERQILAVAFFFKF